MNTNPLPRDDEDNISIESDENKAGSDVFDGEKETTNPASEEPTDFFNLKNSKKASLLSLIQGYREEDIEGYDDTESYGASASISVKEQATRDTHAPARPSAQQQAMSYTNTPLPGYTLKLPEHQPLTWNPVNRGFIKQKTSLSTYKWSVLAHVF